MSIPQGSLDDTPIDNTPRPDDVRVNGKIIKVSPKGYGFISSKEIEFTRIFFHWTSLRPDTLTFKELRAGMKVSFVDQNVEDRGHRAIKVKVETQQPLTFQERYAQEQTWTGKVILIELYHLTRIHTTRNWTVAMTAEDFGISIGLASENLTIARLMHTYPQLMKCKSRAEALQKIRTTYG